MTLRGIKDWLKQKKCMKLILYVWRQLKKIKGWLFLRRLVSEKKNNELILIFREALGDTLYGMSMTEGILKHFPDKKIIVIANDKRRELLNSFRQHERLIFRLKDYGKDQFLNKALCFMLSPGLPEKGIEHNIFDCLPGHYQSLRDNPYEKFTGTIYQLKKNIFHLPDDTPITYHGFKEESVTSIPDFQKNKNRIVIINPYSNSEICKISIYEEICDELIRRGYIVFSNITGEQEAVRGSFPLKCTLKELYSIACNVNLIVSVRSGILDFLVRSGINIFAVYHSKYFYKTYPLSEWNCSGKIEEVLADSRKNDFISLHERFRTFLDELKQEGKLP